MKHPIALVTASVAIALSLSACGERQAAQSVADPSAAATCGKVTVASMNWQSAEVLAAIDEFILSRGPP